MAVELDKEEVISLYETGMTKKEVAQELRVTAPTLSKFMKENDIPTRNPRTYKKSTKNSYKKVSEEKITIINSINTGYTHMKIEKKRTIKNDDKNLYIPEKWNWRSYA
jgi:predicted transcriptional regulator